MLTLSPSGRTILKAREVFRYVACCDRCGKPNCTCKSPGKWMIGWGSTRRLDGSPVVRGDYINKERAEAMFDAEVAAVEASVRRCVSAPLTQSQFDALVLFTHNVGAGAFHGSNLLKKLNARDYEGAAREFPEWDKDDAVLNGRRQVEAGLFRLGMRKAAA